MADTSVDRNLLFGVLALQDDLITPGQFTDVCAGWVLRTNVPLARLLVERGWINEDDREDIERKLERKLKKHAGDVRATLADEAGADVRDVIRQTDSVPLLQSLQMLPPAPSFVRVETLIRPDGNEHRSRYTLSRIHAEGGLGKVWVARDTDLNREVALKELRPDCSVLPESTRRFLKEAQVTGQLEHPNIVPVYELGHRPEDGQPFYTMRFVRGQTMRDAIAVYHQKRGTGPADNLERQKLLSAFVAICRAIGYAHSRGVLHRDLKPENIVLGRFGEVVVLDWGLAKLVDQPEDSDAQTVLVTQDAETQATMGQVGTPVYMAPEQAEGRADLIDPRTDVYGLGAILFEILTGEPPIGGKSLAEVLQRVCEIERPPARALVPSTPRALEAICSKALAKKRADRYQRAVDLADDVDRWMADERVLAYREPVAARVLRWGRRHTTLVASIGGLLVASSLALAVGLTLINKERRATEAQRVIAVANAARALGNLRLAQDAADGLLADVAEVDLADIPQMEGVRRRLLEKARAGFEQFLTQEGDDPAIRWSGARAVVRLGDIQNLLGDAPAAEKSYQQAIALLEPLSKAEPAKTEFKRDLARAYQGMGVLFKDANRYDASDEWLHKAIALRTEIIAAPKASPDDHQALADSRYQLGTLLARRGSRSPADAEAYRAALDVQQGLVKQFADRPEFRAQLARYRNNYGILQKAMGQTVEAETTFRDTLSLLAPLLQGPQPLPGPRWYAARASNNLGVILLQSRHNEAAGEEFHRANDFLRNLVAEFPNVAPYQQELAAVAYNLGLLAERSGRVADAITPYSEAVRLVEGLRERYPKTPGYRQKLAEYRASVAAASSPGEAESGLRKSLEDQRALLKEFPDVPEYQSALGRTTYQLARVLVAQNHAVEALTLAMQARALHQKALKAQPTSDSIRSMLIEDQAVVGLALIAAGRIADAKAEAEGLPSIRADAPEGYFHAAALLVSCAAAAPATPDGRLVANDSLNRAVEILRDAARRRLILSKEWLDRPEFRPLADRDGFKTLRESLAQPPRPG